MELLNSFINFLNENSGAITAAATAILACITLWYVLVTQKIMKTSQEMLRVANTPEVQVSLLYGHDTFAQIPTIDLCIQNIGSGFAHDLKFSGSITSFKSKFSEKMLGEYDIIKNGVSHLGPGKRYQITLLDVVGNVPLPKEPFEMIVTYKDSAKNEKNETFSIDFTKNIGYRQLGDPSFESIADSLQTISQSLLNIRSL